MVDIGSVSSWASLSRCLIGQVNGLSFWGIVIVVAVICGAVLQVGVLYGAWRVLKEIVKRPRRRSLKPTGPASRKNKSHAPSVSSERQVGVCPPEPPTESPPLLIVRPAMPVARKQDQVDLYGEEEQQVTTPAIASRTPLRPKRLGGTSRWAAPTGAGELPDPFRSTVLEDLTTNKPVVQPPNVAVTRDGKAYLVGASLRSVGLLFVFVDPANRRSHVVRQAYYRLPHGRYMRLPRSIEECHRPAFVCSRRFLKAMVATNRVSEYLLGIPRESDSCTPEYLGRKLLEACQILRGGGVCRVDELQWVIDQVAVKLVSGDGGKKFLHVLVAAGVGHYELGRARYVALRRVLRAYHKSGLRRVWYRPIRLDELNLDRVVLRVFWPRTSWEIWNPDSEQTMGEILHADSS